jgi:hypothetical protein
MAEYKFLPLPTEDYRAWLAANNCPGVTADTMLQTSLNGNGDLVFHIVNGEDLEEFLCSDDDLEALNDAIIDDLLDNLSADEVRTALIRLSVRWAELQSGGDA